MYWSLPAGDRFLRQIAESVRRGGHGIVVLPAPFVTGSSSPYTSLRVILEREGIGTLAMADVGVGTHPEPVRALAMALGFESPPPAAIEELLDRDDPPARAVALIGMSDAEPDRQQLFAAMLQQAGQHAQIYGTANFSLLGFVTPKFKAPSSNVMLDHHVWWGRPSRLDVDWTIEEWFASYGFGSTAEYYWNRALCRGLAPNEPQLAKRILEESPQRFPDVVRLIQSYGEQHFKGIPTSINLSSPISPISGGRVVPPQDGLDRDLWHLGLLDWCQDYGFVLHSAVLAHDVDAIKRRIWRGQQELFLPIVEQVRQAVLSWLEAILGPDWIRTVARDISSDEVESILTELGPLAYRVFSRTVKVRHPGWLLVSKLVWSWRNIRNELAHSRMVDFKVFEDAVRSFDRFAEGR